MSYSIKSLPKLYPISYFKNARKLCFAYINSYAVVTLYVGLFGCQATRISPETVNKQQCSCKFPASYLLETTFYPTGVIFQLKKKSTSTFPSHGRFILVFIVCYISWQDYSVIIVIIIKTMMEALKTMPALLLLYGIEVWVHNKKIIRRIQNTEMTIYSGTERYTNLSHIRNGSIINELQICSVYDKNVLKSIEIQ